MQRKTWISMALMLSVLVFMAGCRSGIPLESYQNTVPANSTQISGKKNLTLNEVKSSIVRAGSQLGWVMKPVGQKNMEATLFKRSHKLVIDIAYDTKGYTMTYKDSVNLNYDPESRQIHPQYRNWMLNLQQRIDVELANSLNQ